MGEIAKTEDTFTESVAEPVISAVEALWQSFAKESKNISSSW